MKRPSTLVARLILLGVLAFLVTLSGPTALRWAVLESVRATGDMRLQVSQLSGAWNDGQVTAEHALLLDAAHDDQLMATVERAELRVDPLQLARRRLVVREGTLQGVRFESDCDRPTWLRKCACAQSDTAQVLGEAWQAAVVDDSATAEDRLESLKLIQQLTPGWTQEYDRIIQAAKAWQLRFDELDELVRQVGENPLRMTPAYRARLEQLSHVGREIEQLATDLETLQARIEEDENRIISTYEQDLEQLQVHQTLDPIDGDCLSYYLLERAWRERIASWMSWIRDTRSAVATAAPGKYRRANSRGIDVFFAAERTPGLLVENLHLTGTGRLGAEEFQFHGTVQDYSDQPAGHGQPLVVRMEASGNAALRLEAILDRTGPRSHDTIRVACDALPAPLSVLGRREEFAVEVGPGAMKVVMTLDLDGDALSGRVDFEQPSASLHPLWPGSDAPLPLNESASTALREVREIKGSIALSGSLKFPSWRLESTLGGEVAERMHGILEQELQRRSEQLVAQTRDLLRGQLENVDQEIERRDQLAVDELTTKARDLETFLTRVSERTDLMDRLVHNSGPLENLLR